MDALESLKSPMPKLVSLVCPARKPSICKFWPCGCSLKPHWSYGTTAVFCVAGPKMPNSKNSVCVNCSPVVAPGSLTGHMQKLVCLVWPAQKCPIKKISICKLCLDSFPLKPNWSYAKTGVFSVAGPKIPNSKI